MTYEEWRASRKYRVMRTNRDRSEPVETGLTLDEARRRQTEFNKLEIEAHPALTYWTRDTFVIELETPQWKP